MHIYTTQHENLFADFALSFEFDVLGYTWQW